MRFWWSPLVFAPLLSLGCSPDLFGLSDDIHARSPELGETLMHVDEMSQDDKDMLLLAALMPCPQSPEGYAARCTGERAGFHAGKRDRGWACDPELILMLVEAGADPERTFWARSFYMTSSMRTGYHWQSSASPGEEGVHPYSAAGQLAKGRCYRDQMAALKGHPKLRAHVEKGLPYATGVLTAEQAAAGNRDFKNTIEQVNSEADRANANRREYDRRQKEGWRRAWADRSPPRASSQTCVPDPEGRPICYEAKNLPAAPAPATPAPVVRPHPSPKPPPRPVCIPGPNGEETAQPGAKACAQ